MVRKRLAALIAIAAVLPLAIAACGGDDDSSPSPTESADGGAETTALTVAVVPSMGLVPLYVAEDEGLFEERGLDVTLEPGPSVNAMLAAVGRQFDLIGAIPFDTIQAVSQGLDVVGVTGLSVDTEDRPSIDVIAGRETGIKEIEDLEGKTIGVVSVKSSADATVKVWLEANGVDPDAVEFTEVPFETLTDQLESGRVDAVFSVQPFSFVLQQAGHVSLGSPWLAIGTPPIRASFIAAERSWAEDNSNAVAGFTDAVEEAIGMIERDETVARKVLEKDLQLPPEVAENIPLNHFEPELTVPSFEDWISLMVDQDLLEADAAPEAESLVYSE